MKVGLDTKSLYTMLVALFVPLPDPETVLSVVTVIGIVGKGILVLTGIAVNISTWRKNRREQKVK
jgi:hypothetical protein